MQIKSKLNQLYDLNASEVQRSRGKRPNDSTRDRKTILKYAEEIDQIFKAFNCLVEIKEVGTERGYKSENEKEKIWLHEMISELIIKPRHYLTTNEIILDAEKFIDTHKKLGNKLSCQVDGEYVSISVV